MSLAETLEPYLDSSPSPLVALVGEQAHHAALMELAPGPPRESVRYLSADADTAAFDYCGGASGEQLDGLLDGLVGQLLSKEVMLEPMQHLHAELPRYLAEKGDSLSAADLQRFRKQEQIIGPGRMRTVTSWWCHSSLPRPPGTRGVSGRLQCSKISIGMIGILMSHYLNLSVVLHTFV